MPFHILSRLRRCTSGNVAIVFSLAVVPMMLAAGAGIDMIRSNQARTVLQAAADAAALAGGSSDKTNEAELVKIAKGFIDASGVAQDVGSLELVKIKNNNGTGAFTVSLKAKVKTSFMSLAGVKTLDIDAFSEVKRGSSGPLEMVLALDTTYSMSANDKIGTLKTAAKSLIQSVMTSDSVKAGIVPFSDYMNIGLSRKSEPWVDVPPDQTVSYESCTYTYPNRSGCSVQTTCYADGVPYSCNHETCTNWGEPVKTNCSNVSYVDTWDGCIAAREESLHASIGSPNVPYPGRLWSCGPEIQTLTDSKSTLSTVIDNLYPAGNTHIPSGLLWGWNMLTPAAPLKEAKTSAEVNANGGKKALVLMTDGANSTSPYADGNYGEHIYTPYGDGTYTDNLTATLCENIKAEGIVVYTVLFDVTDSAVEAMLRNCATDPANSFVANDAAELLAAFKNIGVSLTQLRLTK